MSSWRLIPESSQCQVVNHQAMIENKQVHCALLTTTDHLTKWSPPIRQKKKIPSWERVHLLSQPALLASIHVPKIFLSVARRVVDRPPPKKKKRINDLLLWAFLHWASRKITESNPKKSPRNLQPTWTWHGTALLEPNTNRTREESKEATRYTNHIWDIDMWRL